MTSGARSRERPPTLGVNLTAYRPGAQGGAEVYIRNVTAALARRAGPDLRLVLFVNAAARGAYAPPGARVREVVVPLASRSRAHRILAEQVLLPAYVAREGVDWLLSNYVVPVLAPCRQIVNVHDMLYKVHPEWIEPAKLRYWRLMIPASVRRATRVLTVSRASAGDLGRYFPFARSKLSVTVEGVSAGLTAPGGAMDDGAVLARLCVRRPFVLSAATFGPNKNIPRLLEAFARVRADPGQRARGLTLVLTGRKERASAALGETIGRLGLDEAVVFPGFVAEPDLAALYRCADLHVMPSLFEGFGLSVIEAQSFGTPVACAARASLPEVAGEGAVLFDPEDVDDMARAMLAVLGDPARAAALAEAGRRNVRRFTWEQAAEDVLALVTGGAGRSR